MLLHIVSPIVAMNISPCIVPTLDFNSVHVKCCETTNPFDLKNAGVRKEFFVYLGESLVNISSMPSLTSFQHLFLKNLLISTTFHKIWVVQTWTYFGQN